MLIVAPQWKSSAVAPASRRIQLSYLWAFVVVKAFDLCGASSVGGAGLHAEPGASAADPDETSQLLSGPVEARLYPAPDDSGSGSDSPLDGGDGKQWWKTENAYAFRVNGAHFLELRTQLPPAGCEDSALYLGLTDQSLEIAIDGELIYVSGELNKGRDGVNDWPRPFHIVPLPDRAAGAMRALEMRFYSDTEYIGVLPEPPRLGCQKDFIVGIIREDAVRFGIGALALLAVLISLGASFRARRIIAIRSFSFLCLCIGAFIISNRTLRIQYIFYDSLSFWFGLEMLATYMTPPAMILFVRSTIGRSFSIDLLLAISLTIFVGVISMHLAGFAAYRFIQIHYGLAFVCQLWLLLCAVRAPVRGSHTSRITFAGLLVFASGVSYDILGAVGLVPWSHQILSYTFFIMLLFLAAGTVRRNHVVEAQVQQYQLELEAANRGLSEANASLESRVRRRTDWLRGSLKSVNRLRNQQESDYYLTARIMEPTRFRGLRRGRVSVSGFIEQKKKYQYKQWSGDLGGDVCMAHALDFESGTWVCFMNGDAMGKSMQGAGGAIVLATSFQTILNRKDRMPADGEPGPWLSSCYAELQEIFHPFDGKMTVSLIMGAIQVESGAGLYINAGHPAAVLLRDGEARALNEELSATIGDFRNTVAPASLNEFQMAPGDLLLFGSDGREDLLIADAASPVGRRVSLADRFPAFVAEADGDLEKIVLRLEAMGEVADDLSLLRIQFA